MNKESEYTNQGVDREYNLLTEKLSVLASNANADGARVRRSVAHAREQE